MAVKSLVWHVIVQSENIKSGVPLFISSFLNPFTPFQRIGEASHGEALRSTMDLEHSRACDGQFEEEYQPLKAVGKGAFGFVWKAIRRTDGQEVRKSFHLCRKATHAHVWYAAMRFAGAV